MDREYVHTHQLIERYLLGKLSPQETDEFEQHFLQSRETLEELEDAEKLLVGIKFAHGARSARHVRSARRHPDGHQQPRERFLPWAMAASVMLAVALTASVYLYRELNDAQEALRVALAPQRDIPIVYLSAERGPASEGFSTQIALPDPPRWLVFSLDTGKTGPGTYGIHLDQSGNEPVLLLAGLRPDADGFLTWSIHSSDLEPGDYSVALFELGEAIPVMTFRFRILPGSRFEPFIH